MLRVDLGYVFEGHILFHRGQLARRPHRAGDETRASGVICDAIRCLPGDLRRAAVDLQRAIRDAELRQAHAIAPEGVRLHHLGAGLEVGRVHLRHDLRAVKEQHLHQALGALAAEIRRPKLVLGQLGARRAVEEHHVIGDRVQITPIRPR